MVENAAAQGAQPTLLKAVEAEAERLAGGPLQGRRLERVGRALAALHTRFVSEAPVDAPLDYQAEADALAAYLSYFFAASRAQVARALVELSSPAAGPLRVLDLGSGCGPAAFAVSEWAQGAGASPRVTALDGSRAALDSLRRLWPAANGPLETRAWRAGDPLPEGPFDLIVSAHLLNELFPGATDRLARCEKLAQALVARLAPGGTLLLLEPALRRTGRELLVLRDRLVGKEVSVVAPCLFQGACPAIQRPRDWCHADRPWDPPELVNRVGAAAGLARISLKFTFVALARAAADPVATRDASLFRVVSEPLPEKGKLRFFGCGAAGRHALVRLDREASGANAAFGALERGDLVRLGALTASGDGRRLGSATEVRVERSAAERDAAARDLLG